MEEDTVDPLMDYVHLGDDVGDGIFAGINVDIDSIEEGDAENESSGMGGSCGPGSSSTTSARGSGITTQMDYVVRVL